MGKITSGMESATATLGKVPFDLSERTGKVAVIVGTDGTEKTGLPKESGPIAIGEDATSLIFLQQDNPVTFFAYEWKIPLAPSCGRRPPALRGCPAGFGGTRSSLVSRWSASLNRSASSD